MAENNYIMLNLEDEKSAKIAEIMGNKSCKKILSILAEEELTETDISKKINLPLNTTEYNLKKLVESGLVEKTKTHFWSVKGKKIPIYKLSNKYIVIAPKQKSSAKFMKTFLPVVLLSGIGALLIRFFTTSPQLARSSFDKATESAVMAPQAGASLNAVASSSLSLWDKIIAIPSWEWFLVGAGFALILILVINRRNL